MSTINRRGFLKFIGIGGVGVVANAVSGKEVDASPLKPDIISGEIYNHEGNIIYNLPTVQDHIDYLNALYVGDMPITMGTVSYRTSRDVEVYPLIEANFDGYDLDGDE